MPLTCHSSRGELKARARGTSKCSSRHPLNRTSFGEGWQVFDLEKAIGVVPDFVSSMRRGSRQSAVHSIDEAMLLRERSHISKMSPDPWHTLED
jgi:hypothetical protein